MYWTARSRDAGPQARELRADRVVFARASARNWEISFIEL